MKKLIVMTTAIAILTGLEAGAVTKKAVSFPNGSIELKGELYLPDGTKADSQLKAIVVSHPGGGVKEQCAGTYARKLAEAGLVALAFDASYQGESSGEPHDLEDPYARTSDVYAAVDFLSTLSFVDKNAIGALGLCAGGGYTIKASCIDRRIKAVAGISIFDIGGSMRAALGDQTLATLANAAEQRTREANGEPVLYMPRIPDSKADLKDSDPAFLHEAVDYYRTPRAQHPRATNKLALRSMPLIISFSAFDQVADLLTQPLLIISGSESDTHYFSQQAYDLARGKKEMFRPEGATHVALYDIEPYVTQAADKLIQFFKENL